MDNLLAKVGSLYANHPGALHEGHTAALKQLFQLAYREAAKRRSSSPSCPTSAATVTSVKPRSLAILADEGPRALPIDSI
jgi:hypothetical protein